MPYKERYKEGAECVKELATYYDNKEYFKVVVLAPQVFEVLLNEAYKDYHEDLAGKTGIDEDHIYNEIYTMYSRLLQSESIKARLAGALLAFYEADYWENKNSEKQFRKYYTKIESIFSLRNKLAHEYFLARINARNMRIKAKECFDIVDLINEFWYLY